MKLVMLMHLEEDGACVEELLEAVRTGEGCQDARHPVRAVQLPVEASAACRPEG